MHNDTRLSSILTKESVRLNPDQILLEIYNTVNKNNALWEPNSLVFQKQIFFLCVLVEAIKKLNGKNIIDAGTTELAKFLTLFIVNGFTQGGWFDQTEKR